MVDIIDEINRKPEASTQQHSTQREIATVCVVQAPRAADMEFISRSSWDGAMRYAVQRSGMDDYEVADAMHVSHGHMSKVMKGTAGFWGARLVKFMRVTESIAPLQWLADQMGCDIVRRAPLESEVERLKRENAEKDRELAALRRRA
jgi:predicted XRE-type DNA-binding protein